MSRVIEELDAFKIDPSLPDEITTLIKSLRIAATLDKTTHETELAEAIAITDRLLTARDARDAEIISRAERASQTTKLDEAIRSVYAKTEAINKMYIDHFGSPENYAAGAALARAQPHKSCVGPSHEVTFP